MWRRYKKKMINVQKIVTKVLRHRRCNKVRKRWLKYQKVDYNIKIQKL